MFTVSLISPPGHPHALRFLEQARLTQGALGSLGLPCRLSLGSLAPRRINIVLGWHLLDPADVPRDTVYICRQLETLTPSFFEARPKALEMLAGAGSVWDHCEENASLLARLGIAAKVLVPGYHECLETIAPDAKRDIDVLFYGLVNKRREQTLAACSRLGLRVEVVHGCAGSERDRAISRAHVVLSVGRGDERIFDSARVSHLFNNRAFVLSEKPGRYPYPGVPLAAASYDRLPEACANFVANPRLCREMAQESHRQFRRLYPMSKFLWRVLDPKLLADARRKFQPGPVLRPEPDRPYLR